MEVTRRVIIAGCRYYNDYEEAKGFIDFCLSKIRKNNRIIIVSGGAEGADALGERYAEENGFKVERYCPEWEKFGRSAGPRRNMKMAIISDYVICFWDGKSPGTKSIINFARRYGKPIRIKSIENYPSFESGNWE